jgi:hypothetical protein
MLSKIKSVAMKFRSVIDAEKRVIRMAGMRLARAVRSSARVLRIIVFLHSAKDLTSVLRLYGIEDPSETG